ncbi:MAG TPA: cell division protein ZapA [Casimicrobiaceae bacterium]|nr:cell division protein ZapA [Casimicrobiaceae bacterium]
MTTRAAAAGDRPVTLDVSVLGREYKVACREDEKRELVEAVQFLDQRMREIRDAGKVSGVERIAVMAALNIAHELLRMRREGGAQSSSGIDLVSAQRRIEAMRNAIDQVLASA